jgi:molybdopterin-binding protein
MKLSARNVLKAKVKKIIEGSVNDEVIVELRGGEEMAAVITKTSVKHLGLKPDSEVYVVVKANNVILAVD